MNAARPQRQESTASVDMLCLWSSFSFPSCSFPRWWSRRIFLTEGRREKEKEMIWRGKQYTRGVKLYYRKLGGFRLPSMISPNRRWAHSASCVRPTKTP